MTFLDSLLSVALWYGALSIVTGLTFPITYAICRGLPDRGLSLYRPLGLVFAALPVWWFGNLTGLPFTGAVFIGTSIVLGAVGWIYAFLRLDVLGFLRERKRRLLTIELATLLLFFLFVIIRGFNPDIRGTEKPMELAFLNAAIRADSLPVPDPWFAGEPINYYYFGYAVLALLAKVTGVSGGVAFSLGLATTFALATVAIGGIAANLSERITGASSWMPAVSGSLAGFLLMLSGNMHAARELVRDPGNTLSAGWWDGVGWSASRIIEDTGFDNGGSRTVISEFPAFSWILGDLHPHVLAYPWLIASLGLLANLHFIASACKNLRNTLVAASAIGVSIGVLYSSNSWDVAIVALLSALVLLLTAQTGGWIPMALSAGALTISALVTALPFARHYVPAAGDTDPEVSGLLGAFPLAEVIGGTVGYVYWDRTSAGELLLAHGGFLVLIGIVAIWLWSEAGRGDWTIGIGVAALTGVLLAVSMLTSTPALFVIGAPALVMGILAARMRHTEAGILSALFLISALVVIILLEFFYIRDPFGSRMNTIFKVYFQLWAVLSLALAVLVPEALRKLHPTFPGIQRSLLASLVFVLIAMSVYTPLSGYRWYDGFRNWHGIDGASYLGRAQPGEAAAIDWLRDNAESSAVILEAPGCSYGADNLIPHSRISMVTGIPTVIGWDGHQFQWRRQQPELLPEIGERIDQVRVVYEESTSEAANDYLDYYGVTHIVVGVHEVSGYARCGHGPPYSVDDLERAGLLPVFEADGVRIYQRSGNTGFN